MNESEIEKEDDEHLPPLPGQYDVIPVIEDYYKGRNEEKQSLPTFSNNKENGSFSDMAIKEAIDQDISESSEHEQNNTKGSFYTSSPIVLPGSITPQIENGTSDEIKKSTLKKSIFIKLNKFENAQKSLNSVKEKVQEIEILLSNIKDIKKKEDLELKGWDQEFFSLKNRIQGISSDIFDNAE